MHLPAACELSTQAATLLASLLAWLRERKGERVAKSSTAFKVFDDKAENKGTRSQLARTRLHKRQKRIKRTSKWCCNGGGGIGDYLWLLMTVALKINKLLNEKWEEEKKKQTHLHSQSQQQSSRSKLRLWHRHRLRRHRIYK